MFRSLVSFLPVCMLGCALHAGAATITAGLYTLTGATAAGYTITGNLTLDASGLVTAANLSFNDPAVGSPGFTAVTSTGVASSTPVVESASIGGATGQVVLDYQQTPDVAGSLSLCLYSVACSASQASYIQIYTPLLFNALGTAYLNTGSLQLASAVIPIATASTPEPSSLLLLGTGVLGAALLARRGYTQAKLREPQARA